MLLFKFVSGPSKNANIIMVGYPGHFDLPLAKILSIIFRKKLAFNPLIFLYDTIVTDRQLITKKSFLSKLILGTERALFSLPDCIIFDTQADLEYCIQKLKVPKKTLLFKIVVGADENVFHHVSYKSTASKVKVLFMGKFTPLHGLDTIIKAAALLSNDRNIEFTIIGKGQLSGQIKNLVKEYKLKKIEFIDWVPYKSLNKIIARSDISLGIFSSGQKANRVIPNKVFQSICVGRAVITRKSKAITEIFEDKENVLLCNSDDPKDLAKKIIRLKEDVELRKQIANSGNRLFLSKASTQVIGEELSSNLSRLLINQVNY